MSVRPLRSALYMPGSNPRAIDKARSLDCDAVLLDLEDAVAPEAKEAARAEIRSAVAAGGFGPRVVIVRVNGLDTPWGADDLAAMAAVEPDAILVPKVSRPLDLVRANGFIAGRSRLWAMIETPLAILNIAEIAGAVRHEVPRLSCLVMGTNDLAKDTGARILPGRAPMLPWLMLALAAARAHGLTILDGVHNEIADIEAFSREAAQGRDMGFDGKTLIHPSQIGPCNEAFSPREEEVAWARKVIAAFAEPGNEMRGALKVEGRMVERLHADMAGRVVAMAEAIAARGM